MPGEPTAGTGLDGTTRTAAWLPNVEYDRSTGSPVDQRTCVIAWASNVMLSRAAKIPILSGKTKWTRGFQDAEHRDRG
jgi:hypothetical protein